MIPVIKIIFYGSEIQELYSLLNVDSDAKFKGSGRTLETIALHVRNKICGHVSNFPVIPCIFGYSVGQNQDYMVKLLPA